MGMEKSELDLLQEEEAELARARRRYMQINPQAKEAIGQIDARLQTVQTLLQETDPERMTLQEALGDPAKVPPPKPMSTNEALATLIHQDLAGLPGWELEPTARVEIRGILLNRLAQAEAKQMPGSG